MNRYVLSVALLCALGTSGAVKADGLATCIENAITVTLHPETHSARIHDQGRLLRQVGWNLLCLSDSAQITSFTINGAPAHHSHVSDGDTTILSPELLGLLRTLDFTGKVSWVLFKSTVKDTATFDIEFEGTFNDPMDNVQFSREKVGGEVAGTILDQGAYLSPASCYYPMGAPTLATFSLTADIPVAWEAISDGNPVGTEIRGDRKVQRFENPLLAEGCVFMAAPYVVKTTKVDDITVATYFLVEDSSLCDQYLTATANYIKTYQELIGPYPFKQFTVVDNFFPTGYGMPGWTLLGQAVLRLPFIITSSLGHEVLHNWWGNSVYPVYDRGNWTEPLTVYGADYRYKVLSSPEAARDYRKDILKEYLSYVTAGNDFPLRQFNSRSSPETRTIGYNKGMMVFHLIEEKIGTKAFFEAWKVIYKTYKAKAISWEEWLNAFQQTSQQDLSYIIPQWIDRAGAPEIGFQITGVRPTNDGRRIVSLKLTQSADTPYRLDVPMRAEGPGVVESTTVQLVSAEAKVDFPVDARVTTISLDPDYHLFRKLYTEEVEPIVSAVLGVPEKKMVSFTPDPAAIEGFTAFGSALIEDSAKVLEESELGSPSKDQAPVILNPTMLPDDLSAVVHVTADSLEINGQMFPRAGYTAVLAGRNWKGYGHYLVVLSQDYGSLPRLGQLVPHYGKYSYLVFAGAKNVAKGQWAVTESPLTKPLPK